MHSAGFRLRPKPTSPFRSDRSQSHPHPHPHPHSAPANCWLFLRFLCLLVNPCRLVGPGSFLLWPRTHDGPRIEFSGPGRPLLTRCPSRLSSPWIFSSSSAWPPEPRHRRHFHALVDAIGLLAPPNLTFATIRNWPTDPVRLFDLEPDPHGGHNHSSARDTTNTAHNGSPTSRPAMGRFRHPRRPLWHGLGTTEPLDCHGILRLRQHGRHGPS